MNEIYGWCLKGRRALYGLRNSCFISSSLFHVGYINKPFSTCAQLAVWLYSHCQGHRKVICFPLHCTSHVRGLKFKDALQKKTRIECLFKHLRRSVQTVRSESLGVIHSPLCSALPTPTDIAAEDPLEEEFCCRRQNALPGFGLHQRYLRNSAQNPSEEEEEHGQQSLGLTRGPPTRHCRAD